MKYTTADDIKFWFGYLREVLLTNGCIRNHNTDRWLSHIQIPHSNSPLRESVVFAQSLLDDFKTLK